ncbi:MAG: hypothetical protein APF76_01045 [Desulfitibacter sp. BRH_c19]|nr:MAG: hypothetical protein APF76_01045 [Desulfitibacter sp. BRH_c19]
MSHYNHRQWKRYADNIIDEQQQKEMECHLVDCDDCLETYLSIIEGTKINEVVSLVNMDFANNVMRQINTQEIKTSIKSNKKRKKSSDILLYYVAAACITLAFFSSGVFDFIGYYIPKTTVQLVDTTRSRELLASGWTERLIDLDLEDLTKQDWGDRFEKKE